MSLLSTKIRAEPAKKGDFALCMSALSLPFISEIVDQCLAERNENSKRDVEKSKWKKEQKHGRESPERLCLLFLIQDEKSTQIKSQSDQGQIVCMSTSKAFLKAGKI